MKILIWRQSKIVKKSNVSRDNLKTVDSQTYYQLPSEIDLAIDYPHTKRCNAIN